MDTIIIRCAKKYDPNVIINILIGWLKDNGILDLLIDVSRHYSTLSGLIGFMNRNNYGHDLINMSMTWASTPQGHNFWSEWSDRYMDFWDDVYNKYKSVIKKKETY